MKKKYGLLVLLMVMMLAFGLLLTGCGGGAGESGDSGDSGAAQSEEAADSGNSGGSILSKDPSDYYDKNGLDFDLAGCLEGVYGMTDVMMDDIGRILATTSKGDRIAVNANTDLFTNSYKSGDLLIVRKTGEGICSQYDEVLPDPNIEREDAMVIARFEHRGKEYERRISELELEYLIDFLNSYESLGMDECPQTGSANSHAVSHNVTLVDFEILECDPTTGNSETEMHDPH